MTNTYIFSVKSLQTFMYQKLLRWEQRLRKLVCRWLIKKVKYRKTNCRRNQIIPLISKYNGRVQNHDLRKLQLIVCVV